LRNLTTGTALAGAEAPRAGQVAALSTLEPDGRILVEPGRPLQFAYSAGPLGVFVNGLGQFGSRDMTSTVNAYSFNNAGFIAGADYLFTPQLVAGLAFGYTRSSTDFDTSAVSAPGQFLRGDLLQGNLYATYYNDAFYLNGIGVIGGGNNNSRRHIVLPNTVEGLPGDRIANGSYGSQVQALSLGGGYSLPFGALILNADRPPPVPAFRRRRVHRKRRPGSRLTVWQHFSQYVSVVPRRRGAIRDQHAARRPQSPGSVPLGAPIYSRQYRRFGCVQQ
jgi:hypothetical protein